MNFPDPKEEIVTYIPTMRAFALSLTRNTTQADDLVQDAFEKAWAGLDGYKPGTKMRAWLFTIIRNTYFSDRRKQAHRHTVHLANADATGVIAAAEDNPFAFDDFYAAFLTLPVNQREALSLVSVAGFTYEEAAKTCGVAPGTMKSRVNRARRKLAVLLDLEKPDGAVRED